MVKHFQHPYKFGHYWAYQFSPDQVIQHDVMLTCKDPVINEFMDAWSSTLSKRFVGYVLDALSYALNSFSNSGDFWSFLLIDTHFMENVFSLDQVDLIAGALIYLEIVNQAGFQLPTTCYCIQDAIDAMEHSLHTEATKRLLTACSFEMYAETRWYDSDRAAVQPTDPQPDEGPELVRSSLPPQW